MSKEDQRDHLVSHKKTVDDFLNKVKRIIKDIENIQYYDNNKYKVEIDLCHEKSGSITINSLSGYGKDIDIFNIPKDLVTMTAEVYKISPTPLIPSEKTGCKLILCFKVRSSIAERYKMDLVQFENIITKIVIPKQYEENNEKAIKTYIRFIKGVENIHPFNIPNEIYNCYEGIIEILNSYIVNMIYINPPNDPLKDKATIEKLNSLKSEGPEVFLYEAFHGFDRHDFEEFFKKISNILYNRFKKEKELWNS